MSSAPKPFGSVSTVSPSALSSPTPLLPTVLLPAVLAGEFSVVFIDEI
jgi:hypothetical protein